MERIFELTPPTQKRTQNILKQVMLISEENNTEIYLFMETGMGKAEVLL